MQTAQLVVIDSIEHVEPLATIDEHEASQFAAVQHAGFIERNIGGMADEAACYADDRVEEPIFLCQLNRQPAELRKALSEGAPLRPCRDALEAGTTRT